jgi:hypothetical protein
MHYVVSMTDRMTRQKLHCLEKRKCLVVAARKWQQKVNSNS